MIYVFLAPGFEEIEALATVDILRRAGLSVATVGVGTTLVAGAHQISVSADISEAEVNLSDVQAVVLPGGMPGTTTLEASACVQNTIAYAVQQQLPVGAICAAPSILGHGGYLKGVRATCYPGFEGALDGAVVTDADVVTDGLYTTARGAGVAVEFALELVRRLVDDHTAHNLREAIQCP